MKKLKTSKFNGGLVVKNNGSAFLDEKNKTSNWLNEYLGMSGTCIKQLVENTSKSISYKTINALCEVIRCKPGDLFTYIED